MAKDSLTILLIEDNPAHAELVRRSLEKNCPDCNLHHISDGEAALAYLFPQDDSSLPPSQYPNLVLLDLRLPKIDGLEVLKEIKMHPETRIIPVIILTTSEAESDIIQAYSNHANSYMVKPVNYEKFTQMMISLGFYWLEWNQQPQYKNIIDPVTHQSNQ